MKTQLLSKLKLSQFECLCEVVKFASFSHAAQVLGVSQPSVSGMIKKIESELDTQLIDRSSTSFALTESGKVVYKYAKNICEQATLLETELCEIKSGVIPAIHFGACVPENIIMSDIQSFLDKNHNINIFLENRNMSKVPELVLDGHFDIAILPTGALTPSMLSVPYREIEYGLFFPPMHPSLIGGTITPEQLNGQNLLMPPFQESISSDIQRYTHRHNISVSLLPAQMARNFQTLRFMVNEGCGIGLFPVAEHNADTDKTHQYTHRLTDPLYINFSLAWRKDKFLTNAMKLLIEHLCQK